jgi:hypothetical protein
MDDLDYWHRVVQVYRVLQGTPSDEKLDLLLTVYACVAAAARHKAAIEPDGYRTESDRQQHRLWRTAEIIRADAPDAEIERLLVEADAGLAGTR